MSHTWGMTISATSYRRHRFPPEIISHAVWLYYRFTLSYRDVEDLLAQRGITVSYEAIGYWCRKSGPALARSIRQLQKVVSLRAAESVQEQLSLRI